MIRIRSVFLAVSLLVVAACSSGDGGTPTTAPETTTTLPAATTTTTTTTSTTTTTAPAPPVVDWDDPGLEIDLADGWSVAKCEGSAPLICVTRDGDVVGVIERFIADPYTYSAYDPEADTEANLRAIAADFVDSFAADRSAGCGADHRFEPFEPETFEWGDGSGLAYGFRGFTADGAPSEFNLQYSTLAYGRLVFFVAAAYDDGGCPGKDDLISFDSPTLEAFQPHLEQLLAASPPPGGDPERGLLLADGPTFAWVLSLDDGLVVDPARMLSGEEARLQAVADGVIPDGEDLPNDFYIHNPTEDHFRVRIADDARWTVIVSSPDGLTPLETDRATIASILAGGDPGDIYGLTPDFMPFDLLVVNGEVVEVAERYLP